jgi:integrase
VAYVRKRYGLEAKHAVVRRSGRDAKHATAAQPQAALKAQPKDKVQEKPKAGTVHRAKILDVRQFEDALDSIEDYVIGQMQSKLLPTDVNAFDVMALRLEAILRLSFEAGLRAREIAGLRWDVNVLNAEGRVGQTIHITHNIGKRSVERVLPLAPKLAVVLRRLYEVTPNTDFVVFRLDTPKTGALTPNAVVQLVKRFFLSAGFLGCTSHSGRRSFITSAARKANLHGASLKDVQELAGHKHLQTTEKYIEPSEQQRKLVSVLFSEE